jgi:thiol-disulfide isomerase/thioredoxin
MALLGLALAAALPAAARAQDDVGLPLGSTPPAAQVQDLDGRAVDLAQYLGKKPVLVEFWATWCPICAELLPRMQAAYQRYGSQVDFLVVGVGINESRATMQRHLQRHPMPFRFFFDATGAAVRAFQAPSTSYVVTLNAQGRVVYTGVGSDQDLETALRRALGQR